MGDTSVKRRDFLYLLALPALPAPNRAIDQTIGLNTGTYGMKSMKTADALRTLSDIGYDGVELCLIAGWPTDPGFAARSGR